MQLRCPSPHACAFGLGVKNKCYTIRLEIFIADWYRLDLSYLYKMINAIENFSTLQK
ncbi:hypothetical protein T06_15768 [Trichinella sp. T6]|nr:hypothetical protein T06_15768 [Trichinella sp. T6]